MKRSLFVATSTAIFLASISTSSTAQDGKFTAETERIPIILLEPSVATPDTVERTALLTETIREDAIDIRQDVARVRSMARFPENYSWQVHARRLNDSKTHLMRIGQSVDGLYDSIRLLLPRQREALEYIAPELSRLTDSLEEAIQFVNDSRGELETSTGTWSEYEDHLNAMYDSADAIVEASELAGRFFTPATF